MDQEQASDALNSPSAAIGKKLNAKAAEFVPRASASASAVAPPPPLRLLQPMYTRPPSFAPPLPPPYYAYEAYYQQDAAPFYAYNVNPGGRGEHSPDGNTAASSAKNGMPDAHQKVVHQVEFYFSDINLATTDQLFRFMCKDPEGYVPLSVVASFKKVKSAITDITQLASILRSSNKLLVSEDGNNVKRLHPLTESDMEELQSRIVIAENLPEDHSHQKLMKIFSSVGSVKSIRTCAPQNLNGKTGKGDRSQCAGKFHAFVEYESVEFAEKAVSELQDESNWRNGLKVRLLLDSPVKSTQARTKKAGHEGQPSGKKDEATVREIQGFKENRLEESVWNCDARNNELQLEDYTKGNGQKKGRNSGSGGGRGRGKGKGQGQGQARGRPQHVVNGGGGLGPASLDIQVLNSSKASPVPRMPDGTKGFSMGRGKPLAIKTA
ncbi:la-related protein 6B-like isoform X1 [Salvia splendens]|uniref:la-related protein 6B-like isoform X1 n=1 Tax=Salvia splendens TaxID=180675 RepID=UPI001C254426|nr:la-related protein 6B-like isoform X1 [Salvia splendens]